MQNFINITHNNASIYADKSFINQWQLNNGTKGTRNKTVRNNMRSARLSSADLFHFYSLLSEDTTTLQLSLLLGNKFEFVLDVMGTFTKESKIICYARNEEIKKTNKNLCFYCNYETEQ